MRENEIKNEIFSKDASSPRKSSLRIYRLCVGAISLKVTKLHFYYACQSNLLFFSRLEQWQISSISFETRFLNKEVSSSRLFANLARNLSLSEEAGWETSTNRSNTFHHPLSSIFSALLFFFWTEIIGPIAVALFRPRRPVCPWICMCEERKNWVAEIDA